MGKQRISTGEQTAYKDCSAGSTVPKKAPVQQPGMRDDAYVCFSECKVTGNFTATTHANMSGPPHAFVSACTIKASNGLTCSWQHPGRCVWQHRTCGPQGSRWPGPHACIPSSCKAAQATAARRVAAKSLALPCTHESTLCMCPCETVCFCIKPTAIAAGIRATLMNKTHQHCAAVSQASQSSHAQNTPKHPAHTPLTGGIMQSRTTKSSCSTVLC